MGLLFSNHKTNRNILSVAQKRYKDYIIDIELYEYDFYERSLWQQRVEPRVGILFRAYSADTEMVEYYFRDSQHREPISVDCEATEEVKWPKERGQDDWATQLRMCLQRLLDAIKDDTEDDEDYVGQFNEALDEVDVL